MNFQTGRDSQNEGGEAADQDLSALEQGETTFVTGEPKKSVSRGTVGMFGLLAVCLAGGWFMFMKSGPQVANAADAATAEDVGQFIAEGEKHVTLMKQMLKNTDKVVQQFRESTTHTQVPLAGLHTNPFRMEVPKAAGPTANETEAASRRRRDEERAAVVESVRDLRLQLIMFGDARRAALINDQTVFEGQQIDALTVEKIFPDRIILRSGVYRVEKVFQK